eukprot:93926_1
MASREKRLSSAEKEALLLYVLLQEDAFLEEMDQKRQQLVRGIKLLDECEMVSRNGFNEMRQKIQNHPILSLYSNIKTENIKTEDIKEESQSLPPTITDLPTIYHIPTIDHI